MQEETFFEMKLEIIQWRGRSVEPRARQDSEICSAGSRLPEIFTKGCDSQCPQPGAGQPEGRVRQAAHHAEDGTGEGVRQVKIWGDDRSLNETGGRDEAEAGTTVEGTGAGA